MAPPRAPRRGFPCEGAPGSLCGRQPFPWQREGGDGARLPGRSLAGGGWWRALPVTARRVPLAGRGGRGRAEEEPADGGGGTGEGMEGGEAGGGGGLLQQILSLRLVPRVGNGTTTYSSPLSTFPGTPPTPAAGPARSGALPPPPPAWLGACGPRACLTALLSPQRCGMASSCGPSSPPSPSTSRPLC